VFQRPEPSVEHPVGFVLVLADEADDLLGQSLVGLERRVLVFLELEALLGVGLLKLFTTHVLQFGTEAS